MLHLIGRYVTPVISGQPPPPCNSFTFNKVTYNSGILYGGDTPGGDSNIIYITKLTKNTVVSLYTRYMYPFHTIFIHVFPRPVQLDTLYLVFGYYHICYNVSQCDYNDNLLSLMYNSIATMYCNCILCHIMY